MATPKAAAAKAKQKKKVKKNIAAGIAHIQSTFNNTVVTITDINGNAVAWSSAGARGFKGSRKSTPFAAQLAAEEAARRAQEHAPCAADRRLQGDAHPGRHADSAQRLPSAEAAQGLREESWLATLVPSASSAAAR